MIIVPFLLWISYRIYLLFYYFILDEFSDHLNVDQLYTLAHMCVDFMYELHDFYTDVSYKVFLNLPSLSPFIPPSLSLSLSLPFSFFLSRISLSIL